MAAQMVAAPATRGADVEFSTDVFTKEKITPAGRDEVCWPSVSSFDYLLSFGFCCSVPSFGAYLYNSEGFELGRVIVLFIVSRQRLAVDSFPPADLVMVKFAKGPSGFNGV